MLDRIDMLERRLDRATEKYSDKVIPFEPMTFVDCEKDNEICINDCPTGVRRVAQVSGDLY